MKKMKASEQPYPGDAHDALHRMCQAAEAETDGMMVWLRSKVKRLRDLVRGPR